MVGCGNTNGSSQKKEECPDARIIMSVNQADNALILVMIILEESFIIKMLNLILL